jgi:uncharacterized protein YaaQ
MTNEEKKYLLIAVVQAQDTESAEGCLRELEVNSERLPSVGGFLGRRNTTLLILTPPSKRAPVIEALNKSCRQRVEYIAVPMESAPLPLPTPTPISIGGATIFGLEIDHFEEL